MNRINQDLIARMASELTPVRSMKLRDGLALVALATVGTIVSVEVVDGLWRGILRGQASPFFMIANGLLLVLGLASASSALKMACPRVGNRHEGAKWAMAMVAVLPLAGLASLAAQQSASAALNDPYGLTCFAAALAASSITAAALFVWLKRGAPVSPDIAGFHLGVAAGALGSVSYGLACPIDGIVHLGLFHVAPVAVAGLLGRFLVPPLLRW